MKPIYTLIVFAVLVASCKKDVRQTSKAFSLQSIKKELKDSMRTEDFSQLDFSRALYNHVDSAGLYFLRVPFRGTSIAENFVLVKLNVDGNIKEGRIIRLNGGVLGVAGDPVRTGEWDGNISISQLNRESVLTSAVHMGYIEALHPRLNTRETLLGANVLPEVVVVAYVQHDSESDFTTWFALNNIMYFSSYDEIGGGGGGEPGSTGDYYGSLGGYGGSGGGSSVSGVSSDETIELEPEYMYSIPTVDLTRMFKCFDYVSSSGATYSVKLCVDIPSNANPLATTGGSSASSAGHTFLTVVKTNGATSVTQSFGFYPQSEPSFLDPFGAVASSIKDNASQEINASMQMTLTENQFNILKQNAIAWSKNKYQLGDYNCTNYALDIFNSLRSSPIQIQPYKVVLPGNANPWGPTEPITVTIGKSPQMLFTKLQEMKNSNGAESANILIDQTHNSHAPISKGECD